MSVVRSNSVSSNSSSSSSSSSVASKKSQEDSQDDQGEIGTNAVEVTEEEKKFLNLPARKQIEKTSDAMLTMGEHQIVVRGTDNQRANALKYIDLHLQASQGTKIQFDRHDDGCTILPIPLHSTRSKVPPQRVEMLMTEVEKDFKVLAFHAEKEGALMRDLGIGLDDPGKVVDNILDSESENLAIYGSRRERRMAEFHVLPIIESTNPGYFDGHRMEITLRDDDGNWGTDSMNVEEYTEVQYLTGKGGVTKKKIEDASATMIQYLSKELLISGKAINRTLAKELIGWVFDQLAKRPIQIDDVNERTDCRTVNVPSTCIGIVCGHNRKGLSELESQYGVLAFFLGGKHRDAGHDFETLALFGQPMNMISLDLKIKMTVERKLPGHYTKEIEPGIDPEDKVALDVIGMQDDEISYAVGKGGAVKSKMVNATGCVIEYFGGYGFFGGSKIQRQRAQEYLNWLLCQKEGRIELKKAEMPVRGDAIFVNLSDESHKNIARFAELRTVEETSKCLLFTCQDEENNKFLMILHYCPHARQLAYQMLVETMTMIPEFQDLANEQNGEEGEGGQGVSHVSAAGEAGQPQGGLYAAFNAACTNVLQKQSGGALAPCTAPPPPPPLLPPGLEPVPGFGTPAELGIDDLDQGDGDDGDAGIAPPPGMPPIPDAPPMVPPAGMPAPAPPMNPLQPILLKAFADRLVQGAKKKRGGSRDRRRRSRSRRRSKSRQKKKNTQQLATLLTAMATLQNSSANMDPEKLAALTSALGGEDKKKEGEDAEKDAGKDGKDGKDTAKSRSREKSRDRERDRKDRDGRDRKDDRDRDRRDDDRDRDRDRERKDDRKDDRDRDRDRERDRDERRDDRREPSRRSRERRSADRNEYRNDRDKDERHRSRAADWPEDRYDREREPERRGAAKLVARDDIVEDRHRTDDRERERERERSRDPPRRDEDRREERREERYEEPKKRRNALDDYEEDRNRDKRYVVEDRDLQGDMEELKRKRKKAADYDDGYDDVEVKRRKKHAKEIEEIVYEKPRKAAKERVEYIEDDVVEEKRRKKKHRDVYEEEDVPVRDVIKRKKHKEREVEYEEHDDHVDLKKRKKFRDEDFGDDDIQLKRRKKTKEIRVDDDFDELPSKKKKQKKKEKRSDDYIEIDDRKGRRRDEFIEIDESPEYERYPAARLRPRGNYVK